MLILIGEIHLTTKNYIKISSYSVYDLKHPSGKACGGQDINHFLHSTINDTHHISMADFAKLLAKSNIFKSKIN
ncbi:hypothetical protein WH47_11018 [Habropoda laboriosa]|uniref:Uncharacterized protein n=1 Tax=Habropoda laboriosa TaxID=597456 RepID=A0A0L7QMC2_9HYME|nr:hypothetical protein WH47_11018 [Habropoda laboriosa]